MRKVTFLLVWLVGLVVNCDILTENGWIAVQSSPVGADVYLDGEHTGYVTNTVLGEVEPGEHIVRLEMDGYTPYEDTVEVPEADTVLVSTRLSTTAVTMWVRSEPDDAVIWLDGANSGKDTPYFFKNLAQGSHSIKLILEGYEDWDTTVNLSEGDTAIVKGELVPKLGAIRIESVPDRADVYLDGEDTEYNTNVLLLNIPTGPHTVKLVLENYLTFEEEVMVNTSETTDVYVELQTLFLWEYNLGDNVRSSPAIADDGTVYVGSFSNSFYALTADGDFKWSFPTGFLVESSPAIGSDGTVYFGSYDNYIYALTPSGDLKWRYGSSSNVTTSPAIGTDGTVYVGMRARRTVTQEMVDYLYALRPDSVLKWRYEIGEEDFKMTSSPVVGSDGTIYFGCHDHNLYAITPSGTLKWKFAAGEVIESTPAIGSDGTIYFGSYDNKLYAVNTSGTLRWSYQTGGFIIGSPVIGTDGTVYTGSNDGYLYALTPSGGLKWRYNASSSIHGAPAIGADGIIYLGSMNGYLHAVTPTGELSWNYRTSGNLYSSPAISPDGVLYIGSSSGHVYAFQTTSMGLASSAWPKFHRDNRNTGRVR